MIIMIMIIINHTQTSIGIFQCSDFHVHIIEKHGVVVVVIVLIAIPGIVSFTTLVKRVSYE